MLGDGHCHGARRLMAAVALWAAILPAGAATVYRGVDAHGNPVFSDQPQPGSRRVEIAPPAVVDVEASTPRRVAPSDVSAPAAAFVPYTRLAIASPRDEETIPPGAAGNVQVELAIAPQLAPGHRVRLVVDGKVSQSALRTTAFIISNMDRGEHRLRVELVDDSGRVRQQSAPVTIYVQRASRNMPANPHASSSPP